MIAVFATGLAFGLSLIVAIGAQNVFVLRQGALRQHVGSVVAICTVSDLALIAAGVAGAGALACLAVFGLGAGAVAWRDREAVRFHAECARGIVHDARGNAWCPMRAPLAEGTGT